MFRHKWSSTAVEKANALNIEHGACTNCYGTGTVIVDYAGTPDGEFPLGGTCEHCNGSGWEPV